MPTKEEYWKYREKNLAWQKKKAKRIREFTNRLKCTPCADCGKQYNPWVMQFDHRDPNNKFRDVSKLWSEKLIVEEIKKCDLVCANCHAERTHKQGY